MALHIHYNAVASVCAPLSLKCASMKQKAQLKNVKTIATVKADFMTKKKQPFPSYVHVAKTTLCNYYVNIV
jgi:hypothetical protein